MNRVFVLQHLHLINGDEEDVKLLGVYSSRDLAMAAIERFRHLPGFRDTPHMANPAQPGPADGFSIDEFELDQDGWDEGFFTV
ncbi:MAG: serine kinase [Pseudomonadota bacterium]